MMGPCLCGDPCCPSCGDPAACAAADAEIARIEAAVGEDFEYVVRCSCGSELLGGYPDPDRTVTLPRVCANCWAEDHPEPDPGPDEWDLLTDEERAALDASNRAAMRDFDMAEYARLIALPPEPARCAWCCKEMPPQPDGNPYPTCDECAKGGA